jgi:hypothetical protein
MILSQLYSTLNLMAYLQMISYHRSMVHIQVVDRGNSLQILHMGLRTSCHNVLHDETFTHLFVTQEIPDMWVCMYSG